MATFFGNNWEGRIFLLIFLDLIVIFCAIIDSLQFFCENSKLNSVKHTSQKRLFFQKILKNFPEPKRILYKRCLRRLWQIQRLPYYSRDQRSNRDEYVLGILVHLKKFSKRLITLMNQITAIPVALWPEDLIEANLKKGKVFSKQNREPRHHIWFRARA